MKNKPAVGDVVFLNDFGISQVGGLRSAEEFRQARKMRITNVSSVSMTSGVGTWPVEVDAPLIRPYFIDNHCVDLVQEPQ